MRTSMLQLQSSRCQLLGAAWYSLCFVWVWPQLPKPNPLECFEGAGEIVRNFLKNLLLIEELFRHFLIKQTLRTEFQDQEITDLVQTSCSTHSKQSTECHSVCPGSPPANDTAASKHLSVWLWKPQLGYRAVHTEPHQIQIPQVKSRVLGTLFPFPIIYCYRVISRGSSVGNSTRNRERPTGCSQRENSTLLSFSLFCQFTKAWALRPNRKFSDFLLLRMRSLFAIHVYVAGVQNSKKNPEILPLLFL